jgi:hypothetical protein
MTSPGRKVLVVIPLSKSIQYMFGLSAPLAWLFTGRADRVRGVYGHELSEADIREHDTFVIELCWFTAVYEVGVLATHIKRINPRAKILIGGLYSQLAYREILDSYPIDYVIRGDNELPIAMFLDGEDPRNIPNFVGHDFERPIEYRFTQNDFASLDFDLSWFPQYTTMIDRFPTTDNQQYRVPMIITSRGGCGVPHRGCAYCMGSRLKVMAGLYGRPVINMDNDSLIHLVRKAERFGEFSIYITSDCDYDLTSIECDAKVFIEIDGKVSADRLRKIMYAFRRSELMIPVHSDGIMGGDILSDCREIVALSDDNHVIKLVAYADEVASLGHIPDDSVVYVLDTFLPEWSHFDVYSRWDKAVEVAKDRFAWILWQLDKHGIVPRNKTYMKSYIRTVMGDHPALRPGAVGIPTRGSNRPRPG